MKVDPTIERLNFNSYSNASAEHLHRYAITEAFINQKYVLDIASGEGYGSYLMSRWAKHVYGVDIDLDSIKEAEEKYIKSNLKFIVGSAEKLPLERDSIDVVVSFETIEHHNKHDEMLEEVKRVLKPNGVLIISSPDKEFYSDKIGYTNQFHVKELYFNEFKDLVKSYFSYTDFYFQKAFNLNSYIAKTEIFDTFKVYIGDQKMINTQKMEPLYNIAIASDTNLLELSTSFFNGEVLTEKKIDQVIFNTIKKVKNSFSFKIGKWLMKRILFFRKNNK